MAFSRAQRRIVFGWFALMAAVVLLPPWVVPGRGPRLDYAFVAAPPDAPGVRLAWSALHGELFVLAVGMLVHLFVRERAEAQRLRPEDLERLTEPF